MANMLDYLVWRGDLSLEQAGIGPVDALILSELSYLHFEDRKSTRLNSSH